MKTKAEFYSTFVPLAQAAERRFGVPVRLTLAQAALESQWGRRPIGNNYFGIKRAARHKAFQVVLTSEQEKSGAIYKARLAFADYPTIADGVMDYAWLISNGAPYRGPWQRYQTNKNLAELAQGIAKIYATSHSYTQLLLTLLNQSDIIEAAGDAA
jgi:flagellum-specific peptidoglycan hydrolase FlgJ